MFSVAFAYAIFACGFSLVSNDPCLAPICVVDKPCVARLPPCVRLSETNRGWNWVKIEENQVRGVPRKENKFNLKHLLTEESCQITITVLSEAEKELLGVCDYKRSNDSLRDFHEVGKTYPVQSAEALHKMLSDGVPSSPIELTGSKPETKKFVDSSSIPLDETVVPRSSSALSEDLRPDTFIPIIEMEIIIDEDSDVSHGAERKPIVEEIRIGDLFEIELRESSATFEVQGTSPNTRVVIEDNLAVGFTIFHENQKNYEFNVSSTAGKLLSFKLQPLALPAIPSEKQSKNHRFVTESQTSLLDLKGALRQIRKLAENEAVEVFGANSTHILWLNRKYLSQPLCTYENDRNKTDILSSDGNTITRLETLCSDRGNMAETEEDMKRVDPMIHRILKIFLMPVFPLVLSVMLLIWFGKYKILLR